MDNLFHWRAGDLLLGRPNPFGEYFYLGYGGANANIVANGRHYESDGSIHRPRAEADRPLYTFANSSAAATKKPGSISVTYNIPNHTDAVGKGNQDTWVLQIMAWGINNRNNPPSNKKYCPIVVIRTVSNGRLNLLHYRDWYPNGVDAKPALSYDLGFVAKGAGDFTVDVQVNLTTGSDGYVRAKVGNRPWVGTTGRSLDPNILKDGENSGGYRMQLKAGSYSAWEAPTFYSKVGVKHVYYTWPYLTK